MGFLKFLKREKKKESLDEFDLPPAPPPLEGFDEKLDFDFPEFSEEKISAPEFDFGKEEKMSITGKEDFMQDFSLPEIGEEQLQIPPISAPIQMPEPMPTMMPHQPPKKEGEEHEEEKSQFTQPYQEKETKLFPEKRISKESLKTVYIRIDNFKVALGSINMVRNDLKKSEEVFTKLENIRSSKEKLFDKVKNSLGDLQKKLIFIDKTLFKGE